MGGPLDGAVIFVEPFVEILIMEVAASGRCAAYAVCPSCHLHFQGYVDSAEVRRLRRQLGRRGS